MDHAGRKKITELYQIYPRTREYRDAEGKIQHTQETYRGARLVEVISGWDRFWHYLIDALILGVVGFIAGLVFEMGRQRGFGNFSFTEGQFQLNFTGIFISFGFYFFFEMLTASTPGKMIFGRVVINEYAEKPDPGTIAIRTISRSVPFEAFSCLGERGWHDKWSKTFVVTKEEAARLFDLRIQQEKEAVQNISEQFRAQQQQQPYNPNQPFQ
jgi:uncharacterized RDD family membrane protein YckC